MSEQWAAVMNRGQFYIDVVTRDRLREDGGGDDDLPSDRFFLGICHPDGADPVPIAFERVANLATFVKEMAPREVHVYAASGEDARQISDAITEMALSTSPVQ